ncbi:MAG: efflux transporter outer membrane subunit [Sphingomonadaceae bacterium]
MTSVRALASCALAASICACSVGPPYVAPQPTATNAYTAGPAPSIPAQQLQPGASVAPRWWESFGSPALDRLETQALARNPALESAQHTLEQARYNLVAAEGIFYPQVALNASGERIRASGAGSGGHIGPSLYNLYTGQVSVSYYPDAFGLNRLVAEDANAQVDVAHDQLLAAQLAIEGNVASTVFELASLEARIAATRQTIADQQEILDLVRTQYRAGAVSGLQVATQESQLASAQAELPALEQARDQARHLLATYLGEPPAQAAELEAPQLAELTLPPTLPLSVPTALVHQRPDILAAEAQLRSANARVGEAVARLYPQLVLTGDFGAQSNETSKFFDPASRIWDLAAAALAPLFTGGTLRAQKHAAQEAYGALFANYRSTVLAAFRDVADALRALEHDAAALEAQKRALDAADTAFGLARSQYQAGAVGYLGLLVSEVQLQNARVAYVGVEAQRFADSAALYVALGGGVAAPHATREEK